MEGHGWKGGEDMAYRKLPSVLTERSWRINQTPILLSGSVSLKALALRLPIRFLVNMPEGCPCGCAVIVVIGRG